MKKNPLATREILGGLIIILPSLIVWVASLFGKNLTVEDATTIVGQLQVVADKLNELIGFAIIVWGRFDPKPKRPVSANPFFLPIK